MELVWELLQFIHYYITKEYMGLEIKCLKLLASFLAQSKPISNILLIQLAFMKIMSII